MRETVAVRRALALAVAVLASACSDQPAPPALSGTPDPRLTGDWRTAPVPSGSGIGLSLQAAGGWVVGTGGESRLCCWFQSLILRGRYQHFDLDLSVSLKVEYSSGRTATFVGSAIGSDSLVGRWTTTSPAGSFPITFYRLQ
jgi:hypothetical protein